MLSSRIRLSDNVVTSVPCVIVAGVARIYLPGYVSSGAVKLTYVPTAGGVIPADAEPLIMQLTVSVRPGLLIMWVSAAPRSSLTVLTSAVRELLTDVAT